MISEGWEDVFAVFDAAVATSGVERDALLARECGDNAWLRGKVESLLAAHQDAEGFLSGGLSRTTQASGGLSSPVSRILEPGTRIGVFEVERFAGAGGMGEVYRARDTRLDRHVALKILSADGATDPRRRARFAYEARAIARLSHPHICALHDLGHHDGVDFLVMEYLRRRNAGVAAAERSAARCGGRAHCHSDRGGAECGTCRRHRAQRPETGQHHAGERRLCAGWRAGIEAARLRARPVPDDTADRRIGNVSRRSCGVDRTGCDRRYSAVHGARTGARRGGGSPKRYLLVRLRALRDGFGTRGLCGRRRGRCHVRHSPRGSSSPAVRSISIGGGHRQCIAPAGETHRALPGKGPGPALRPDARRQTRASGDCARPGGNQRAPLETTDCRRRCGGDGDRRGDRASPSHAPGTATAALDESRAIDLAERPRNVADVFAGRHAGGVFLERRARGQLRHLREDGRLVGRPTTDDRSR